MKNVLFAVSEAVPFIKTGGLADVAGALPKAFDKKEYDIKVMLPKYACCEHLNEYELVFEGEVDVELAWRKQYVGVFSTVVDGVTFYLLDSEYYFSGQKPYGQIYEDIEKFSFYSKAVFEACKILNYHPDIIHCHDWQAALVPVYLKTLYKDDPLFAGTKSIFTIHNLLFQGRWIIDEVKDKTGLPESVFANGDLECYGEGNLLKGAVLYADKVTTVSQVYADEMKTPEGGEGLDNIFRFKGDNFTGIVNGLDTDEFDPSKDKMIFKNYDVKTFKTGKRENKLKLQKMLGLNEDKDVMLIGMVSRLSVQKGFDLITYMAEEFLTTSHSQLVFLGSGEDNIADKLCYLSNKYPGRVSTNVCYSEDLSRKIYAGCDVFLMPSQFEPCGLSQLISMRYGTIPLVRETGGLKETVEPYNEYDKTGRGFSFANYNAHELLETLRYAQKIFYDQKKDWDALVRKDMKLDFSWEVSAEKYKELYDGLLE